MQRETNDCLQATVEGKTWTMDPILEQALFTSTSYSIILKVTRKILVEANLSLRQLTERAGYM